MRWATRLGVVVAVLCASAVCAVAGQASPTGGGWSAPAALTDAGSNLGLITTTETGGAGIYTLDSSGAAAIANFTDGAIGALAEVPDGSNEVTGSMSLPDGAQILTGYPNDLDVQLPDGSFGPPSGINEPDASDELYPGGFAATADQLVNLTDAGATGCASIQVQTSSISADGTITPIGGPSTAYSSSATNSEDGTCATTVQNADITLDPDGRVDVLALLAHTYNGNDTAPEQLYDFTRLPGLTSWTASIVSGASNDVSELGFASAPGGRAVAEFVTTTENSDQSYTRTFSYTLRDPGSAFGTVSALPGSSQYSYGTFVAAGSDGTLALSYEVGGGCGSTGAESVAVFAPGDDTPLEASVPDSENNSGQATTTTALGAGDGSAIVGENVATGDVCFVGTGTPGNVNEGDVAAIVGADGTSTEEFGVQPGAQKAYGLGISAAGIDTNGNAVAYGSLSSSGADQYATYGSPGSPVTSSTTTSTASPTATSSSTPTSSSTTITTPTTSTSSSATTTTTVTSTTTAPTTTTTTTTSDSPTTSTAAPPPPGSPTTSSTTTAPPTQTRTSTAVSSTSTTAVTQTSTTVSNPPPPPPNPPGLDPTDTVAPSGTQNITISNGNSTAENIAANEIYVASGLVNQIENARGERSRPRTHVIEVGRFSITVPAHSRRIAHLRLTRQALGLLRHHGRLRVTLTVITKIHGRTTSTIVRHLVLRAAPIRRDRNHHAHAGASQRESRQLSIALIDLPSR